jgi:hypothetical protein
MSHRFLPPPRAAATATATRLASVPLDLAFKVLGEVLLPRNNPDRSRAHRNRFKFSDVLPAMPPVVHDVHEHPVRSGLRVRRCIPTADTGRRDIIAKADPFTDLERPTV